MGATLSPFSYYKNTTFFLMYQIFYILFSSFLLMVEAKSISRNNSAKTGYTHHRQSRTDPPGTLRAAPPAPSDPHTHHLCSIIELLRWIMLNYMLNYLIFSELSG